MLVLDDLHAADAPSLLLLRFLARELGSARILLLVAYRQVDPLPGGPLTTMIAEVGREPISRRLTLRGLSESEIAEYLRRTGSEFASLNWLRGCMGRPKGTHSSSARWCDFCRSRGDVPRSGGATAGDPANVRHVIARRLCHFHAEAGRLLILASVLGREFLMKCSLVSATFRWRLARTLDEAVHARVVSDVPE